MSNPYSLSVTPWLYKVGLLVRNPVQYFKQLLETHGEFVHVRSGVLNFVSVNHPELIEHVLQNKDATIEREDKVTTRIRAVGRTGLATSDGPHWKKQRRNVQPLFTAQVIRNFGETMIDTGRHWIERWEALHAQGGTFDAKDETSQIALEVNARCLFATDVRSDQERLQAWFATMKKYMEGFPFPIVGEWWFPAPLTLKTKRAIAEFDRYTMQLIEKRKKLPMDARSKDLVARMLLTRDPETGAALTEEEIHHEMLTFFLAGYETTASAMTWVFYHLSQHPEVAAKVRQEVDGLTGGGPFTMEHFAKLDYTTRVVDEVMRLTPSAWFMGRSMAKDASLGGHEFKRGTMFVLCIPSLHNNPKYWPNPTKFDPDRFLPENERQRPANTYIPFSRGPHSCIGKYFALQELVVVTAMLAQRFDLTLDHAYDPVDVICGISMYPKGGLRMRAVPSRIRVKMPA